MHASVTTFKLASVYISGDRYLADLKTFKYKKNTLRKNINFTPFVSPYL